MAASLACAFSISRLALIRPSSSSSSKSPLISHSPKLAIQLRKSTVCFSQTDFATQDVDNFATVFSDETNGIVCYRSHSGEVICEGPDEGPHFDPCSTPLPTKVMSSSIYMPDIQVAGVSHVLGEGILEFCTKDYKGVIFCEGMDES